VPVSLLEIFLGVDFVLK